MHYLPLGIVLGLGDSPPNALLALVQPAVVAGGFALYSAGVSPATTYGCDSMPAVWGAPTGVVLTAAFYSATSLWFQSR